MSENIAAAVPAAGQSIELITRPIPTPGPTDVLIRASVVAINPVDRARQAGFMVKSYPAVIGSDVTGTVISVGADVTAFKKGDRVIAVSDGFATGDSDREAFQTYVLAPALTTAKLPDSFSFVQGSSVSLVFNTAAVIFFDAFGVPLPGKGSGDNKTASGLPLPSASSSPIVVIWGGASAVGTMTIQLAHYLGYTVYTTASPRHHERLRTLGADVVVDYSVPETAVQELVAAAAAAKKPVYYAVDTVNSLEKTIPYLEKILVQATAAAAAAGDGPRPKLIHINMLPEYNWQAGIDHAFSTASIVWSSRRDIAEWVFAENLTRWLADGTFVPPIPRIVPGGLATGVQAALDQVKGGVSGEKLVVEVA